MAERNDFPKKYSEGRVAKTFAKEGVWKLPYGQVILKEIPDITLSEVMDWGGMVVSPNGTGDPDSDAFKFLQRNAAQGFIDNLYNDAPEIAERLDKELNPGLEK